MGVFPEGLQGNILVGNQVHGEAKTEQALHTPARHCCLPYAHGVISKVCVVHTPLGPGLAHRLSLALSSCPVGSYANAAELRICVIPGSKVSSVVAVPQPFLFVKLVESRMRLVPVVVSVTVSSIYSKGSAPVLVTSSSTHQPSSGQLSIPL